MLSEFNNLEAVPKSLPFPYHVADALKKYEQWDVKNLMEVFGIAAEHNSINTIITKKFEWDPEQPIEDVLADVSRRQFGEPAGKQMRAAWGEMKKAFDLWNDMQSAGFPLAGSQFYVKMGTAIGGLPCSILREEALVFNLDGMTPEFMDKMVAMNNHLGQAASFAKKAVDAASSKDFIGICNYEGPNGRPTCKEYAELNYASIAIANALCTQRCNILRAYPLLKGIEKAREAGDEKTADEQETQYRKLVKQDIKLQERFCDLLTDFSKMKPCYTRTSFTEKEIADHLAFTKNKIEKLKAYLAKTSVSSQKS